MNLFDLVLNDDNKNTVADIARQFNLNEDQTRSAIGSLLPSLQRGLQNNTQDDNGLEGLLAAVEKGRHQRYINDKDIFGKQESVDDGNSILGHVFGNKDVSRRVARHAAKETGLSDGLMKKLLPIVASIAMGAISKQLFGKGVVGGSSRTASTQSRGIIASMLDSDNDGSVIDDLLGLAVKFMR